MKAFGITAYNPVGDLSGFRLLDVPKPSVLGEHDMLVRVKAVSTNPIDLKLLGNRGKHDEPFNHKDGYMIVGFDGSGIVEQVGSATSLFKIGDEVMFAGSTIRHGCYAEYVVIDERIAAKKPAKLSFSQAAAIPLTTITAWEGLVDLLCIPLDPKANAGKTILVTGGAGGLATVVIEIAKHVLGLTVIATSSREETRKVVQKLGADYVINHHKPMPPQIKALGLNAEGTVNYVYHGVDLTPDIFADLCAMLKPFGRMCGVVTAATVNLDLLKPKSLSFSAEFMFLRANLCNEESLRHHEILTRAADLVDKGILSVRESVSSPLNETNLKEALTAQGSGKNIGKITLYFED